MDRSEQNFPPRSEVQPEQKIANDPIREYQELEQAEIEVLRQKFQSGWSREKKEGDPELHFTFLFSEHKTGEDFKKLKNALKEVDIIVPEMAGWDQKQLEKFNMLSRGKLIPRQMLERLGFNESEKESDDYQSWYVLSEALYKSRKPVVLADLPDDHPLMNKRNAIEGRANFGAIMREENFDKALVEYQKLILNSVRVQIERETYILEHLGPAVEQAVKENSSLKNKTNLNIGIIIGSFHVGLNLELKRQGEKTKAEFRQLPYYYCPSGLILLRLRLNKEVSKTLLARGYLEALLWTHDLLPKSKDSNKINTYVLRVCNQFTYDEISEIFKTLREKGPESIPLIISAKFKEKAIKIPENEEELDNFIK